MPLTSILRALLAPASALVISRTGAFIKRSQNFRRQALIQVVWTNLYLAVFDAQRAVCPECGFEIVEFAYFRFPPGIVLREPTDGRASLANDKSLGTINN